jgi:hypothetical protein
MDLRRTPSDLTMVLPSSFDNELCNLQSATTKDLENFDLYC